MTELLKATIKETGIPYMHDKLKEKLSPSDLLKNSKVLGISGDMKELRGIQIEVDSFVIKKFLPREGGEWSGEVGNSTWKPNFDEIPKRPPGNEKTWGEILGKYEVDGIEFKDGEPDFTPASEGTVEIKDFSTERVENFTQADEALAEQWTQEAKDGKEWNPQDIREYRRENNLSWHERSDMKTLDLSPQEVHGNIPHSGGISAAKQNKNMEQ